MAKKSSGDFYLANELVFEILSWMPVTSLLRFKSVCKSWSSIISSTAFCETHLINTKKKQPSSLICLSNSLTEYLYPFSDVVCIQTIVDEHVKINIPRNFIGRYRNFCSCNGLLFHLKKNDVLDCEVLFIWNPLTKWLKELPAPEKQSGTCAVDIGFGFDFISNDYKIMRIVCFPDFSVELYSVNSDSWKQIQVPNSLPSIVHSCCSPFVHVNGVLYLEGNEDLLAFDLHTEVFGVFSLPNTLQYTKMSSVLDYEGSVAMIFKELDGDESVLSLWTLDDVSWSKKFNLEADEYLKVRRVYQYLGFGQFFARDYNYEYIIYDHRKKQTKKFPLTLLDDQLSLANYTESLVSVEGFEQQDSCCDENTRHNVVMQ